LSAAPQAAGASAAPQAAGASAGLSPAPQAEPQAAGFSSGLSAAPQAEAGDSILFHPNRLESAMIASSFVFVRRLFALCVFHYTEDRRPNKYAPFYYMVTFL
jgi:hypothetical protein